MTIIATCGHDVTYETEYVLTYTERDQEDCEITASLCRRCYEEYSRDRNIIELSVLEFKK